LVLFICLLVVSADTGLRLSISASGVQHAKQVLEPLITDLIESLEPISIPPYNSSHVNISNITLVNTTHTGFDISINPQKGLMGTLKGFGAYVKLIIFYRILSEQWSEIKDDLSVVGIDIGWSLGIQADAQGKPLVNLELEFTNVNIDIGNPNNISDWERDLINVAIDVYVRQFLPDQINPQINEAINKTISEKWHDGIFDLFNLTGINATVDYRLSQDPVFDPNFVSIPIQGHTTLDGIGCPLTFPNLPKVNYTQDLEIILDRGMIECLLDEVTQDRLLQHVINDLMKQKNISFDNRVALDVALSFPPDVTFSPDLQTTVSLGLNVTISKNELNKFVPILTLDLNASATVKPSLSLHLNNSTVVIPVQGLGIDAVNASFYDVNRIPKNYLTQIQNEDWGNVTKKVNELILSTLGEHPVFVVKLPDSVGNLTIQKLTDIGLFSGENYVGIRADIHLH